MRFVVILLVSFVALTTAEVLHVKCGDEKCERPSNRAMTTLRYTPDKPYKLQIYAVNSEVEIFGMTDDLYYIRHGKNYGFLPKNHLREKARGNYPFEVSIDIGSRRIDQTVREQNFLFEFLKSSQPAAAASAVNETVSEPAKVEALPAPVNEPSQELDPKANEIPLEVNPKVTEEVKPEVAKTDDTKPEVATSDDTKHEVVKPDEIKPEVASTESDEDSGIDEEDDEEDDEEEDEDSEEVPANPEVANPQPELIAIPPGRDIESQKIEEVKPEKPLALPVAASSPDTIPASSPETIPTFPEDLLNATAQEPPKSEEIPAFIPMKDEVVQEAASFLDAQNETLSAPAVAEPKIEEQEVKQPEVKLDETMPSVPNVQDLLKDDSNNTFAEEITEKPAQEPSAQADEVVAEKPHEPAVVPEAIDELPQKPTEAPEVPAETETIETIIETTTEAIDIWPEAVEIPQPEVETTVPEVVTNLPEALAIPEVTEPEVTVTEPTPPPEAAEPKQPPPQPNSFKPHPDALLQRFNEKLGNRVVEGTGKGSVEPLHRQDDHHVHSHGGHSHDHSHGHDDHHHHHEHPELPELKEGVAQAAPQAEEEEQPGFFVGLFRKLKFFSDKDDSEQHFHDHPAIPESLITPTTEKSADSEFCEKIDSENCPQSLKTKSELNFGKVGSEWKTADEYIRIMLNEAIEMMDMIISMALTALTVLIFTLGYYCINRARKEGPLIAKMNELERHLMAACKENDILKGDVVVTKQKLMSIENNSFGSNDMVIALKQDLESTEQANQELEEKIGSLEKELEAAAEDGLELNRMVSELLNNQTGSESIISSVEDLQRQLNEQQETIVMMNETLAAKSRENSELQIQLSEINGKFQGDFTTFQQQIDAVALERTNLQIELENLKRDSDTQVNQLIEERNSEVTRLNNELTSYAKNYDDAKQALNKAESRVQSVDECLKAVKSDSKGGNFKDLFDVADLKADLLAVTKEKSTIQEQLQIEKDSRKLLDDRVKSISEEMSNLKKEFGVAEKEKLEAQTRLEVLSTYFKEKETQLQRELSLKEARWMKQQGETTTTVEKVQSLNQEIQTLKSQNDSLRAEIEAQVVAHRLNISSLEGQSHAAWLNARQAERRLEESRMESLALRRKLTSIAENPAGAGDLLNGFPSMINDTMNSLPSPIRVESPNTSNVLPPAPMMLPPFLPQGMPGMGFLPGAPPSFLPPPPFMPGEMGPPLGRLMSPPPKRFTPTMRDDRDRYSPRGRGRYSPDSRYDDYTAFETETDYSPPPSPSPPRRGYTSPSDRSKKSKGHSSGGSIESNPSSRRK